MLFIIKDNIETEFYFKNDKIHPNFEGKYNEMLNYNIITIT